MLAGSAAGLCGTIAAFSLVAAIIASPATGTVEKLRRADAVSRADRLVAATALYRAGQIFEPGRYLSDAASAAQRLQPAERRQALDGGSFRDVIDAALRSSPSSPYNWARRAELQLATNDLAGARGSLEMSLMLGRFVPALAVPRSRILLDYLQRAPDPTLERAFEEQVRIAARVAPKELAQFADGGAAEGRTQRILSGEYTLFSSYLDALLGYRAQRENMRQARGK